MNDIERFCHKRGGLTKLLCDPLLIGVGRDIEVDDGSSVKANKKKDMKRLEVPSGEYGKEIDSKDGGFVVLDKSVPGAPGGGWWSFHSSHVFLYGST